MPNEDVVEQAKYGPLRQPPEPVSEALETLPYGLYVIGSRSEAGELNGMIADWLMQVSFKPRLVGCSFENDSTTLKNVRATDVFSVNVLPVEALELAATFAQPHDATKIKGRSWYLDETYVKVAGTWRYLYRAIDRKATSWTRCSASIGTGPQRVASFVAWSISPCASRRGSRQTDTPPTGRRSAGSWAGRYCIGRADI